MEEEFACRESVAGLESATEHSAREDDGHPNVALLKMLARVINEEAGIEELEADGDWRAA